jgi:hypothetical protein
MVMNCSFANCPGNYDLVFSALPGWAENCHGKHVRNVSDVDIPNHNSRFNNRSMLLRITKFIECPKRPVPSLIRLERAKKRLDLIGHMLTLCSEGGIKIPLRISEREERPLSSGCHHNGRRSMVKGRAKVLNSLNCKTGYRIRQWPFQSQLVDSIDAIDIRLTDTFVILRMKKANGSLFQVDALLLCPSESLIRTGEFNGMAAAAHL